METLEDLMFKFERMQLEAMEATQVLLDFINLKELIEYKQIELLE